MFASLDTVENLEALVTKTLESLNQGRIFGSDYQIYHDKEDPSILIFSFSLQFHAANPKRPTILLAKCSGEALQVTSNTELTLETVVINVITGSLDTRHIR